MNDKIGQRLVDLGHKLEKSKTQQEPFSDDRKAKALIDDIEGRPHAFLLACIADRQVKADIAWQLPLRLSERIGGFSFGRLRRLSEDDFRRYMAEPPRLHRFYDKMAKNLFAAIQRIDRNYRGDAARIWSDRPGSAELVYRLLQFRGVGPKIATMTANILVRWFRVPVRDRMSIDISADVQVRRLFQRLGLVQDEAGVDEVIYRARMIHPKYPGLLDLTCWDIGRRWCRPKRPKCDECDMRALCPRVGVVDQSARALIA
jgi:endonuclease-3